MSDDKADDKPSDNQPTTELVRGDLARYVMEHVAPGAREQVEENILREVKQERDLRWEGKPTYWLVEVRPGVWETTSVLPYGLPPIRVHAENPLHGAQGVHWQYACLLSRSRVARWPEALKMARETEFRCAGKVG